MRGVSNKHCLLTFFIIFSFCSHKKSNYFYDYLDYQMMTEISVCLITMWMSPENGIHGSQGRSFLVYLNILPLITVTRAVEILCLTCPTWSHFIQDKLKLSIYLYKICVKFIKFCISYFD